MNTKQFHKVVATVTFVALLSVASYRTSAQGTFQNLNFEDANPVIIQNSPYYPYAVTAASALPYWTVTYGGVQQTQITENDPSTGSTWVSIVTAGNGAIDGNYSVLLQGGLTASDASISQSGLIPAGTQSLFFEATSVLGTLEVLIGGQTVPFAAVGSGPNYILYGANISAWAGDPDPQQLTFSALENGNSYWTLDDISFSTEPVPEPGIASLAVAGGLILAARKWLARSRNNFPAS